MEPLQFLGRSYKQAPETWTVPKHHSAGLHDVKMDIIPENTLNLKGIRTQATDKTPYMHVNDNIYYNPYDSVYTARQKDGSYKEIPETATVDGNQDAKIRNYSSKIINNPYFDVAESYRLRGNGRGDAIPRHLEKFPNKAMGGELKGYATGGQMDNQLSSDSFQVQGNPNVTDGNHYPEQNINLDHNEVVDTKRNFVFSDDLKIGKKSFATMAVKPSKAIGKAEKVLQRNPYDQQAKKTIEFSNRQLGTIAATQEELATLMGLRQPEQQNFAAGGTYQDPVKIYNPFDPYSDPFNPYSSGLQVPANMLETPVNKTPVVQSSPSGIPYPRKGRVAPKTAPTGLPNGPLDPNYRSSQQGYMDMLVNGNAGDYTPTAPMQPLDMLNRKSVTGQHNWFTEPDGTVRDLAELSGTAPTTVNSPIQISRENKLPTLNTVDASKNPNDVSSDTSARDKMTLGDYLQFAEVGSKFFQTLRGPEVENQILDNTRITKNNYDVKPQLQQSQRSYQNAVNNIDSPSLNLRRALTNNLYAGKLNADSQVITQYDNMNKQSNSQYEQQLSNQRRYNIQSTQYTNNLNAANRGAYDSVVQNAYTSVGNLGEALNRRKTGQDALKVLSVRYPEVYKEMMAEIFGKKN